MITLQNLDVHGTFGVHRSKMNILLNINALAIKLYGFITLAQAGFRDQLDRYHFDLYRYSRPE